MGDSDERTRNVARSLKLSLDSLPKREESRSLLAILAGLPGGARLADLPKLVPDDVRPLVPHLVDQLLARTLVDVNGRRLTMLSPIRLYLQSPAMFPVAERERNWEGVEGFFFDLAGRCVEDSPSSRKIIWPRVIEEEANIENLLKGALSDSARDSLKALQATLSLTYVAAATGRFSTSLFEAAARTAGTGRMAARSLLSLGDISGMRADYERA